MWLTVLLLAPPLGVVLGYTMTYWIKLYHSWEWSFCIQAFCLLPCIACLVTTPSRYLNIQKAITFRLECQKRIEQELYDNTTEDKSTYQKPRGFGEYDNQTFLEKL